MTTAKDSKLATSAGAGAMRKVQAKQQGGPTAAKADASPQTGGDQGTGLLGLSAAFLVGAAVGLAAGADQQPARGADVRLSLDDDPKDGKHAGHQDDYGCGL
ncbi:hypothetical protein [Duganella callida]|uniref:Uncharacterized protein n=1 Tax=Duganella callida TaxID=2561932 RepID=A0A4Y9STB2_9BURK|nr:hypothetical protein [Duganella callida]TFW28464.1 hypothetical protein E4L98_05600 [Duganella callida]